MVSDCIPIRIGRIKLANYCANWLVFLKREYGGGVKIAWWAVGEYTWIEGVFICRYFGTITGTVPIGIGIIWIGTGDQFRFKPESVPIIVP